MPVTHLDVPILSQFSYAVRHHTGLPVMPQDTGSAISTQGVRPDDKAPKQLPKGVVLGKDGKPCRSCTSFSSWAAMTKQKTAEDKGLPSAALASAPEPPRKDCPADVEELGRGSWTMLHTLTANYPEQPSRSEQESAKTFMGLFANWYPCGHCAEDFQDWMRQGNEPAVQSRDAFGRWMCMAHNAVNEKLGKDSFDCNKWEERWRTGPSDGRCG